MLSKHQGLVRLEELGKLKIELILFIGSRIRGLLDSSRVPQATTLLPRASSL
jgi:hypothetical protein